MAAASSAFAANEAFISFSPSPEPEPHPPFTSGTPSSSYPPPPPPTSAAAAGGGGQGGSTRAGGSSKRSREAAAEEADEDEQQAFRNRKEERRASSRDTPWVDGVDWFSCRNPAEMLNREIRSFVSYISPTASEHATRSAIVSLIRRAVLTQWPDSRVSPFGSFETGLYLPNGDIDLVIESHLMGSQNKVSVLHTLAAVLRRANLAENIQVISKAKVPIVKFISSYGRLPVDISINQSNGISAGRIVNSYISSLPALKPLVLVVKAFLAQRGMNEVYSGGLGSYSVICLVISFLQLHPKVRKAELEPLDNLGVLLIEFFELYGKNFGYDDTGISLRDGGTYFSKEGRGWHNERQRYLLSIEDPQDSSNDVARSSHGILRVKSTFSGAYEVLTSRLYIRAEGIARRRQRASARGGDEDRAGGGSSSSSSRYPHHKRFDDDDDRGDDRRDYPTGDEMSILVGIMGVTPEVLAQRRTLKALYTSGVLQERLGLGRGGTPPDDDDMPAFRSAEPFPTRPTSTTGTGAGSSSRSGRQQSGQQQRTKVSAIHVESSSPERENQRRRRQGRDGAGGEGEVGQRGRRQRRSSSSSGSSSEESEKRAAIAHDDDEFAFVDQPFRPTKRARAPPGYTFSSNSTTQDRRRPTAAAAAAKNEAADEVDELKSEEDSRYSVGKLALKGGSKNKRRKATPVDAFAVRPPPTREEGELSDDVSSRSSSSSSSSDHYIEGQEELLATSDEDDFEEQERRFRQAKKTERRRAREAKRSYWLAKGGDGAMDSSLRYGGLLSD